MAMYSSWVLLMAGQLLEMITNLDCPFLRAFIVALKPGETNGDGALALYVWFAEILTDSVLAGSDGKHQLLVDVLRCFALHSHFCGFYTSK